MTPGIEKYRARIALEAVFDRPVDLLTERSIRNPIFRRSIEKKRLRVYDRVR